jgi:DNA-binding NarL/FixJ family response regulator
MTTETPTRAPIQVLLVDDHRVVRAGLAAYIGQLEDMDVVGEAANGSEAVNHIATIDPDGSSPDVVLMDLVMPVLDGIEATRQIKARWPAIEVVVMTSFVEESKVRSALEAGAAGYLLKDSNADQVADAIRAAFSGKTHLDPEVARLLAESLRGPARPGEDLTPREREVLRLVAAGASNRQIAEALVVSERTARTHVSSILSKLGLVSRTQAALWAVREGFAPST